VKLARGVFANQPESMVPLQGLYVFVYRMLVVKSELNP
jgi:hypothetical protein